MTAPVLIPAPAPAAAPPAWLRRARVLAVEQAWGREGVWCGTCRRSTPVEQLQVLRRSVVLRCETCSDRLLVLPRRSEGPQRVHR